MLYHRAIAINKSQQKVAPRCGDIVVVNVVIYNNPWHEIGDQIYPHQLPMVVV